MRKLALKSICCFHNSKPLKKYLLFCNLLLVDHLYRVPFSQPMNCEQQHLLHFRLPERCGGVTECF